MNFPEIKSWEVVELIGPEVEIVTGAEKRETRIDQEHRDIRESDDAAMARFAAKNPHLMQAGYEYRAQRNKPVKEDEADPSSRVIELESDDNVQPNEDDDDEEDDIDWDNLSGDSCL